MTNHSFDRGPQTPWSELRNHVEGFLDDPNDAAIGDWAIGQGPDSPDRVAFRRMLSGIVETQDGPPTVLEVGVGSAVEATGLEAAGLLDMVRYRGIDLTPEMIAECRRKFPGIPFEVKSVFDLSRESDTTDLVLCRHILEHIDDGLGAIERMCKVADHLVVISWFIRPTWYPGDARKEWLDIVVDGSTVSFLHQTYDVRLVLSHLDNHCDVASCTRIDFDHHGHPCSVWLIATSPQGTRWASLLSEASQGIWACPASVDTSDVSIGVFYPNNPIATEPVVMWSARRAVQGLGVGPAARPRPGISTGSPGAACCSSNSSGERYPRAECSLRRL